MPGLIRPHAITMSRVKFPSNRTTVTVLQSFSFSAESLEIFYQVPKKYSLVSNDKVNKVQVRHKFC